MQLVSQLRKVTLSHVLQLIIICTLVYIAYELSYIYDSVLGVQIAVRYVPQGPVEVYADRPLEVKIVR
jgi:hypothetical protein